MNFQKIIVPVAGVVAVAVGWQLSGWGGVALVAGAAVMWLLLHFSRMMQVLKRAANRPVGYVDSAVMLNAKLRPGATLLHVIAMTRSLGQLQSPKDAQPEIFRWTDGSQSHVTCEFAGGKLARWKLERPAEPAGDAEPPAP
ncbi:MAG: glycerate kinase [Burkholderiales bacterium]|nr:glycerate kinase [Burkholderiales bacterium]